MKKLFAILPVLALSYSMNANAGFWDELAKVNQVLGTINGTTSTSTTTTSSYPTAQTAPFAQITPVQEQRIGQVIQANTSDKFVNQAIMEAKPNIEGFLKLSSCQNGGSSIMAGKYQSPQSYITYESPILPKTKYHALNQCLTVQSVGNFHIYRRDELNFDVVYVSDVSAESFKRSLVMKREPDGQWLLTHFYGL